MRRFQLWAALFAICVLVAGCGKGGSQASTGNNEPLPKESKAEEVSSEGTGEGKDIVLDKEALDAAGIVIGEAREMPMQGELKVAGTVTNTSQGRAVVTPPVAGKITRLHVRLGDTVRQGQAIATLQSAELAQASAAIIEAERGTISAQAAVREAMSEIDLANARLRTARSSLTRQQEFARTGAFSQPSLQAAQRDLSEAEAELQRTTQDLAVHLSQLERAEELYKQELISRTDLEQAQLQVDSDKVNQKSARQRVEISTATLEREQSIAKRGLANSREIQAAEAEVRAASLEVQRAKIRHGTAVAGVSGASKGLQAARVAYTAQSGGSRGGGGGLTIVAPIGGVITKREATLGQAVERTSEICEIENLRSVWVTANVPDMQVGMARRGGKAQVTVAGFPNRVFHGVVQVVGSRLDAKSRTMPVQVLVDNSAGLLRPDMLAQVTLGVGSSSMVLAIPRSAITSADGDTDVFIAEEANRFMRVKVKTGRTQGDWIEIVDGLKPGQKVAVKGVFTLLSESKRSELKGDED